MGLAERETRHTSTAAEQCSINPKHSQPAHSKSARPNPKLLTFRADFYLRLRLICIKHCLTGVRSTVRERSRATMLTGLVRNHSRSDETGASLALMLSDAAEAVATLADGLYNRRRVIRK
jgi:hypothetical protein